MNNNNNKVQRGDIFYYDFGVKEGSIQSGIRPVLILQCDDGNNASPTTIVAAITTAVKKRYLPTHVVLGAEFGLKENSMVLSFSGKRSFLCFYGNRKFCIHFLKFYCYFFCSPHCRNSE